MAANAKPVFGNKSSAWLSIFVTLICHMMFFFSPIDLKIVRAVQHLLMYHVYTDLQHYILLFRVWQELKQCNVTEKMRIALKNQ